MNPFTALKNLSPYICYRGAFCLICGMKIAMVRMLSSSIAGGCVWWSFRTIALEEGRGEWR